MSVTNIINERNVSNNGSDLDVFGNEQTIDIITNNVNERVEIEERLSENLINNGDFSTDSDWDLGTGWSYGSNKVISSATTSEIQQDVDFPSGKVYKTTFTIEDYVSGSVRIRFRGSTTVNGTYRSGNGTYTEILTSTGHTNVKIDGNASFTGSVDNVSVKEVGADREAFANETDQHNSTVTNIINERTV